MSVYTEESEQLSLAPPALRSIVANHLHGFFSAEGDPIVSFVPINGTNRLMTLSRDPLVLQQVRRWGG